MRLFYPAGNLLDSELGQFKRVLPRELALLGEAENVALLPPAAKVRLAAFSLRVPGTDSAAARLRPLDSTTLKPSDEQLPEILLTDSTELPRPRLSLFFETDEALPFLHAPIAAVFDARTEALVSFENHRETPAGRWTRIDFDLKIWHDTPLQIGFSLLAGEAEFGLREEFTDDDLDITVPIEPLGLAEALDSAQVLMPREWQGVKSAPQTALISWNSKETVFEVDLHDRRPEQFALLVHPDSEHSEVHWFSRGPNFWSSVGPTASLKIEADPESELRLVFLPKPRQTWFELGGLPGMPGKSDLENLMDVPIPEITVEVGESYGPEFLPGGEVGRAADWNGNLLKLVCGAAELNDTGLFWITTSEIRTRRRHPSEIPFGSRQVGGEDIDRLLGVKTEVFRDVTPWQLLEIYRRRSDQSIRFEIDASHQLLIKKTEPTALQKTRDWWAENAPDWLQF